MSEGPTETRSERRAHRGPVTRRRMDAAAQARTLAHALVACHAEDETFVAVEALLAEANAILAAVPHLPRSAFDPGALGRMRDDPDGPNLQAMADRAVAGPANPTSVDIASRIVPGGAEAKLGNVGSASIYFMLEEIFHSGLLKKGQKLLLGVPESARFSYVYALVIPVV